MSTLRFLIARLSSAVPTLLCIVTITFFLIRFAPGGPFDQEQALPADVAANLNAAYGLDRPIVDQYLRYLHGLLHGDFGPSFRYRDFTVTELIDQGLPVSFTLGGIALLIAVIAGVGVGTLAAVGRGGMADRTVLGLAVLGVAVPSFVLLPALGLLFGVELHWLPVAGWNPGRVDDMVLPVVTLALPPLAYIARLQRGSMSEALQSPYVRTAFAKGLPLRTVVLRHALRPALIPVVSYLAPAGAMVMTGSLVVETIAGLPGIGRYLVQGALNRDYTLVLGMVIVYSTLLIALGLVADLLIAALDPRVSLEA
ncbi:MAG: ABC transporter permease subunit [Gammaproteobacteria bacterium]|nr:ABC transporter permease subunit [Gammaproteobacteria bacterium]